MEGISTKYTLSYAIRTYEDMKKTYNGIMQVIQKLQIQNVELDEHFEYSIGQRDYRFNNINQFIEYGYGMPEFKPRALSIHIYENDSSDLRQSYHIGDISYLSFRGDEDFSSLMVHATSNQWLEKIMNALDETSFDKSVKEEHNIYIENQYNNAGVVINGGQGNTVSHNDINNRMGNNISKNEPKESKTGTWIQGVLQGLSANLIWQVIVFLFFAVIAYLGLKK